MEWNDVRVFLAVAREGTLGAAARKLGQTQPTMGRLADLFGPRRVYLVSLALVALAGLGGAFAPSLGALVAVRILLGVGTSGEYPSAMRIFRSQSDRLGTPQKATDATKTLDWALAMNPNGAGTPSPATVPINLRWPGQHVDSTGYFDNGYRTYIPITIGMRYAEVDPVGLAGSVIGSGSAREVRASMRVIVVSSPLATHTEPSLTAIPAGARPTAIRVVARVSASIRVTVSSSLLVTQTAPSP